MWVCCLRQKTQPKTSPASVVGFGTKTPVRSDSPSMLFLHSLHLCMCCTFCTFLPIHHHPRCLPILNTPLSQHLLSIRTPGVIAAFVLPEGRSLMTCKFPVRWCCFHRYCVVWPCLSGLQFCSKPRHMLAANIASPLIWSIKGSGYRCKPSSTMLPMPSWSPITLPWWQRLPIALRHPSASSSSPTHMGCDKHHFQS